MRAVLLAALALPAAACGSGSLHATPGVVRVVAAENFWGDIAKQIGGAHVEVTSLISRPTDDPHLFESNPRTLGEIASADLVIENGLGYDGFVGKALDAVGGERHVLVVADALGRSALADSNPHLWYWTERLPQVADAIAEELAVIDPADRSAFRAGATRFVASLEPLRAVLATIKRKYAGEAVGYTERLPEYLLNATHLDGATPRSFARALEDGDDPSPADLLAFEDVIRHHEIKVLIYNAQVADVATERLKDLAHSAGVPVVGMTESMPSGDRSFQAWQLRQARELLAALGG
jgi:zinc/manganese transport system substrate-binding protein